MAMHPAWLQRPVSVETEKRVSYNCCSQGTISLRVELEHNIFSPGDLMVFTTEVGNQTGRCIRTVAWALLVHVQYKGFTPNTERRARADSSQLARQDSSTHIPPYSSSRIVCTFQLPQVLPLSGEARVPEDDLLSAHYELVTTVHLPWSLASVKAKVPVVITHPPLSSDSTPGQDWSTMARPVAPEADSMEISV